VYFYEGRTVRGVGWMSWGLLIQLASLILGAVGTVLLIASMGAFLYTSPELLPALFAAVALICGLVIVEIAAAVVCLVGFHGMYAGRHEYGPNQDRNMDRALVFVILAIVLSGVQVVSPYTLVWGALYSVPSGASITVGLLGLVVQPASALFAGLALFSAVRLFADGGQRTRLIIGMILGAVGAAAGMAILLVAAGLGRSLDSLVTAFVASALAGQGTSAISLLVFILVYREVRRKLETGGIAPAVPSPPPVWPYYYSPPYPYQAAVPQAPVPPPSPPQP